MNTEGTMTDNHHDLASGDLLAVLRRLKHGELKEIVASLARSWDVMIKQDKNFEKNKENLENIPALIGAHILRAGGSFLGNQYRGSGPPYQEILRDVCKLMKVKVGERDDIIRMEERLLYELVERMWNDMSPEERKKAVGEDILKKAAKNAQYASEQDPWMLPFSVLATQIGAKLTGFIVYQVAVQVANLLARQLLGAGLTLAVNAGIARGLGVLIGPIGWVLSGAWLALELQGPSYRGLVPTVFLIAVHRQRMLWAEKEAGP